jgi:hypothetical protein
MKGVKKVSTAYQSIDFVHVHKLFFDSLLKSRQRWLGP